MKALQIFIVAFLLPCWAIGQIPTNPIVEPPAEAGPETIAEDICWTIGAVDSSLTRFTYINPQDTSQTTVLYYVNASGAVVTVSGGSIELGYCGCCDEGVTSNIYTANGSTTDVLRTVTVQSSDNELSGLIVRDTQETAQLQVIPRDNAAASFAQLRSANGPDVSWVRTMGGNKAELSVFKSGIGTTSVVTKPDSVIVENGQFYLPETPEDTGAFQLLIQADGQVVKGAASGGPAVVYDTLTSGNVTAIIAYQGGDGVTILNPAAGRFVFVVQKDTHLHLLSVKGDNTTLNASQEMEVQLDNSSNAAPRRGVLQLYDANNNSITDQFATGTVHTQVTAAAVVTYTVPGLNGFGATGFIIEVQ